MTTSVDNKLTVVSDKDMEGDMSDDMEDTVDEGTSELTDAKIATVIKTRLLMDTDISGFDIDVDVENGVVAYDADGNVVTLDVAAVETETIVVETAWHYKVLRAKRNRLLAESDWVSMKAIDASIDGLGISIFR